VTTQLAIIIGLILYVVLTTGVSFLMVSRVRKPADYLVAGRGLPHWVLIGTIVGTCIGTGVIIGGSGLAYKHGWAGCAYPIGLGIGTLLTGIFFAKMRRYNFMTLSEEIACYYGGHRGVVEFSNILLFVSQLCWLTVQILGGAAVVGAVTGLPHYACVVIAGFAKAIISIPGGLKAVVYTDVLQTCILFGGFAFLIYSALKEVGGMNGLRHSVPADYFSFLGMDSLGARGVASLLIVLITNPLADPARRLTMYSAKSESAALRSMVLSGLLVIAFSVVIGITGMYAFKLNPNLAHPDDALPWLAMNALPPWLAALVVMAVVSGMSSAANACAASAGTFYVRHIFPLITGRYPKQPVVTVRRALAVAFLFSTVLALRASNIVGFVQKFLPLTMSGIALCAVVGRFWKRATPQGALAALITTPVVAVIIMLIPSQSTFWGNPTIPAGVAGLAAHIIVSFRTPRPQLSIEQVAEKLAQERKAIEEAISHVGHQPAPAQAVQT
jgi:SSS family solute:Na+ symporter